MIEAQNLLPEKWKFHTGDDPVWASPSFDDSGWHEIIPGTSWEKQGFGGYDGFAWYRVTVTIPSHLKTVAKKYGGFILRLGRIDDVDFTYFNGKLLGSMGELPPNYITRYDADRAYKIPARAVLWDQPNTIAVRVFDLLGDGGIYGFPVQLTVVGLSEYLTAEPVFPRADFILDGTKGENFTINMVNRSKGEISGKLTVQVVSDFGANKVDYEKSLVVPAKGSVSAEVVLNGVEPGFYKAYLTFDGLLAYERAMFGFGYEPEQIVSPPDPAFDFERYWQDARAELAAVKPRYNVTRVDSLCTPARNVFLVEMHSLGDVRIRGWYSVPSKPGKYPAVMQVPGYSGNMLPEYVDYGEDIIGFGLNIRGHGNSQDDVDPGFPGYLFSGIGDKETYIYRGAYMDCVRGIDFLFSRPEVDTTRVGVEGGSQGGALTFATAALDNGRIKVCVPLVPFLSDFRDYFRVAAWPANEFTDFMDSQWEMSWDDIFRVLSYIDIKNLAGWIRAPMLMGVGLVDDVCPPHINFAAYNQVKSEKRYIVYPYAGHGLPEDFYEQRMKFIREKFGLDQGE